MHSAQLVAVTLDAPSEGETGAGAGTKCGDKAGRNYDYGALAQALDFVVMDYDSNNAHGAVPQTIDFVPKSAAPYQYNTREAAQAACVTRDGQGFAAGKRRLYPCAFGWTSDWNGYWMATAAKVAAAQAVSGGEHEGAAGAYCCGGRTKAVPLASSPMRRYPSSRMVSIASSAWVPASSSCSRCRGMGTTTRAEPAMNGPQRHLSRNSRCPNVTH